MASRPQGRLIVTGGIIGWDTDERLVANDLVGQFRQVLANTLAVLGEGGAGPEHIVRMTWYITDRDDYVANLAAIGDVYRELIGRHYPAMAVVQVAGLIEPDGARRDRNHGGRAVTGQGDRFVADRLPPADRQPLFLFDRPELQYPEHLNAAVELIDRPVAEGDGARIAVRNDAGTMDLCRDQGPVGPDRPAARRGGRAGPRQPRAAARTERGDAVRGVAGGAQGGRRGGDDHADAARGRDRRRARQGGGEPCDRRWPLPRRFQRSRGADRLRPIGAGL